MGCLDSCPTPVTGAARQLLTSPPRILCCPVQAKPEVVAKTSPRLWHGTINQVRSATQSSLWAVLQACCAAWKPVTVGPGTHLTGSCHHDIDDMYMTVATRVFYSEV